MSVKVPFLYCFWKTSPRWQAAVSWELPQVGRSVLVYWPSAYSLCYYCTYCMPQCVRVFYCPSVIYLVPRSHNKHCRIAYIIAFAHVLIILSLAPSILECQGSGPGHGMRTGAFKGAHMEIRARTYSSLNIFSKILILWCGIKPTTFISFPKIKGLK